MRESLFDLVGKTEQTWIATFSKNGINEDWDAGTVIEIPCFTDVHTIDGKYETDHCWIMMPKKEFLEQTKNFKGGETVCFKGYVAQYGKSAHKIDYTIKGIKELVAFNPNLILENDFAQSVYNLHDAHHTQKEIATLLGVNINKVYDIYQANRELKKAVSTADETIRTTIKNLRKEGRSDNEIAKVYCCELSDLEEYLY